MPRDRLASVLAGASLLFALAAMLFLTFWTGFYQGETFNLTTDERVSTSSSLIDENGLEVLWIISFPVTVAAVGLFLTSRRTTSAKIALWLAAGLLAAFCLVGAFTVGLFFVPAALALVAAAALHQSMA